MSGYMHGRGEISIEARFTARFEGLLLNIFKIKKQKK